MQESYIQVRDLSVSFNGRTLFRNLNFDVKPSENIALIGPNASGKSALCSFMTSKLSVHQQTPHYAKDFDPQKDIALVSFEFQSDLYAIDDYFDDTDFIDFQDKGTSAREAILLDQQEGNTFREIIDLLDISYLLDRGIRFLSTGEMRKVLIARALLTQPKILIIDSPFEGLDRKSKSFMRTRLTQVMKKQQCILLVNEDDSLLDSCDTVYCLEQGNITASGKSQDLRQTKAWQDLFHAHTEVISIPEKYPSQENNQLAPEENLIHMEDISVKYGDTIALNKLSWTVKQNENWIISGPNGAGKSTLLSLVSGENPQGYNQELYLFGRKRGSGETIWDIRKRIGLITSKLQLSYKQPLNAHQVVVSGFFDSIGLYQKADKLQVEIARKWLDLLEVKDIHKRYFSELSYGEQRLVLLARAMVKHPTLLILDEPCQGLDTANRQATLNLIDYIALNCNTRILYVSHSHEEALQCITHKLEFFEDGPHLFRAAASKI